jgi:hypothetical protein
MISIAKCSNCGKECRYPLGAVDAHILLAVVKPSCPECRQRLHENKQMQFCGPGCLKEFVLSEKWGLALDELTSRGTG